MEGWTRVWERLGPENLCFAYNRLGIGKSSPPEEAQTGMVMAKDLKALLMALEIKPPYVLVGHSLGGFIVHLFALMYPEEVQGIVFLESATIKDVTESRKTQRATNNPMDETNYVLETVLQIETMEGFPRIPIRVVIGQKPAFGWLMPKEVKEARKRHQAELIDLSGSGDLIPAKKSGHFPQLSEPELVVEVIHSIVLE